MNEFYVGIGILLMTAGVSLGFAGFVVWLRLRRQSVTVLRARQAARVMPKLGNLIDLWEQMPNDVKSDAGDDFMIAMLEIASAMEATATRSNVGDMT